MVSHCVRKPFVPELRPPYIFPSIILNSTRLFCYFWAVKRDMHWAMMDIDVATVVCGGYVPTQGMLACILDGDSFQ